MVSRVVSPVVTPRAGRGQSSGGQSVSPVVPVVDGRGQSSGQC